MSVAPADDRAIPVPMLEERILVLAPTGRDAQLTCELLVERAGLVCEPCHDVPDLCDKLAAGAGAAIIAQEALAREGGDALLNALSCQPPWSDLSLIILTGQAEQVHHSGLGMLSSLRLRAAVTLLERPIHVVTLISAVQAALRARRRQYEVRDLLAQRDADVRHRDEFLAMLGHELRNPLGTIRNAMASLDAAFPAKELEQDQRQIISRQTEHLARLVDDLLDVSRLTRGKISLRREPVDLGELAARAASAVEASARAEGHQLCVSVPSDPVVVDGDPARLEQVLNNLLTNAIKYTPAGGKISLSVESEGASAVIRVRDTGIGMAQDLLPRVFDLFSQARRSLDRSQGGLGIGLALVRRLVAMHGGTVVARSEGEGCGSDFVVTLAQIPQQVARTAPVRHKQQTTSGQHVLVIEDNADSRRALQRLLQIWGHTVETACDGLQGVAVALQARPAIALVDIGLPGLDGYEVARRIRAALRAGPRLIALTGYGQPEDRERAQAAGFDLHLTKPVDPIRLAGSLGTG